LKQHRLTFFIQQAKQLLSVNYISTNLNPGVPLRSKSEFFKLEDAKISHGDDDAEAMSKRGYTKPRLAFDWSEPPPSHAFEEHDDESTCSSLNFQEFLASDLLEKGTGSFGYDDLMAADPYGFSTALVPNPPIANSPPQPTVNGALNGNYADLASFGSPQGVPGNCYANL